MTTEEKNPRRRRGYQALKAEDLVPALMCLARLVHEMMPSLPSGATDEAQAFVRAVEALRETAHV